jgi:low temperature requirement protein LtrA
MKKNKNGYGMPIVFTLVCIGPFGNLILDIINSKQYELLKPAILSFFGIAVMTTCWVLYFINKRKSSNIDDDD